MARFLTEDTYTGQIDNPLSLNLYTYVHNNPLVHTDPSGHCFWDLCIAEGVGVVEGVAAIGAGLAAIGAGIGVGKATVTEQPILPNEPTVIQQPVQTQQPTVIDQPFIGPPVPTVIEQPFIGPPVPTIVEQPIVDSSVYILASSNSALLRKNLNNAGYATPSYANAAHHIVAAGDNRAAPAQAILSEYGVDIDSADNGVFLPTSGGYVESNHRKIHTNVYYQNVNNLLQNAESKEEVIQTLGTIRTKLQNGTFPIQ